MLVLLAVGIPSSKLEGGGGGGGGGKKTCCSEWNNIFLFVCLL